ncbi:CatB-related O-acetyltransferase [Paenibacillus sp. 32352]|uniref:CatB-related O-acetyltransferase n=1 Tax=Paenibacillus sp. 32352 TaxID=1969111 RepID=UPI002119183E|nr:CatB-related O-acetyltransferase [Paenibacillus sp. 32352]
MIYEEIICSLMDLLEDIRSRRNVYIFGAGKSGKMTLFGLYQLGVSNVFYVDNDSSKWDKTVSGIKVLNPIVLKEFNKNEDIILVASYHYNDISQQLSVIGLQESNDYYPVVMSWKYADATQEHICDGVKVGKYSYGYKSLCNTDANLISIGAFCSINETAKIVLNHPVSYITTHPFLYKHKQENYSSERVPGLLELNEVMDLREISNNGEVIIGNDVWIGANVVILPSVTIGNGAIIAAGAVVTKSVPDYAIVAGVPAKILKYRFSPEEIEILNRIQWWGWPDEKIKENYKYFMNNEEFFNRFKEERTNAVRGKA